MKFNKKIVIPMLAVLALGAVGVGATYALFTSDAKTDVAIQAGKVKYAQTVEGLTTFSGVDVTGNPATDVVTATAVNGKFTNGGSATYENGVVTLSNMTPGDKVTFSIKVKNSSNVSSKMRTFHEIVSDDGLFDGLVVTINGTAWDGSSEYASWAAKEGVSSETLIQTFDVVIDLPTDRGNEYQEKNCSIKFGLEAVQGNAATKDLVTVYDKNGANPVQYSNLQAAFDGAHLNDIVTLNQDIRMNKQVTITTNLTGITLDGDGHTVTVNTTKNPTADGNYSAFYFGKESGQWAEGVNIKDININGNARFGFFFRGGKSTNLTNVNMDGNFYYAINLNGTHGAVLDNCNIVNNYNAGAKNEAGAGIWSNVGNDYPLVLKNGTTVDEIAINEYTDDNPKVAKIYVNDTSSVGNVYTYDDSDANRYICVDATSKAKVGHIYTVKSVSTIADMNAIEDDCLANVSQKYIYILNNDLDYTGQDWRVIGEQFAHMFAGAFNGGNHVIKNADSIKGWTYGNGLFSRTTANDIGTKYSGCLFADVTFEGCKVKSNSFTDQGRIKGNCSGIVAYTYGEAIFDNVNVKNCEIAAYGKVGAILGFSDGAYNTVYFRNCSVKNSKVYGHYNVANLCGCMQKDYVIENCDVDASNIELGDLSVDANFDRYDTLPNGNVYAHSNGKADSVGNAAKATYLVKYVNGTSTYEVSEYPVNTVN